MNDKSFLQWIHDRLQFIHKEDVNVDYMHKLRAIIKNTDLYVTTANVSSIPVTPTGIRAAILDLPLPDPVTCNSSTDLYSKAQMVELRMAAAAVTLVVDTGQQFCPNCCGSGEVTVMNSAGPDAYDVPAVCPHCDGNQLLLDAYVGVVKLLKVSEERCLKASYALQKL